MREILKRIHELACDLKEQAVQFPDYTGSKKSEILTMIQGIKDEAYIIGLTLDRIDKQIKERE